MHRDIDPRTEDQERPDVSRGGRVGSDDARLRPDTSYRDVFHRDLHLPRGRQRERVRSRSGEVDLRASEARALATVGALRVVSAPQLRDPDTRPGAARKDLAHLREMGLIQTRSCVVDGARTTVVTLTARGRDVLERARPDTEEGVRQVYHAGDPTLRELQHDLQVHAAYREAAEPLVQAGHRIRRVVLEVELKRAYQQFLHEPTDRRRGQSGRPDRDPVEIARWAEAHQLPLREGRVQFPDVRIEIERPDGRLDVQDLEIVTPHYRGAHAAAKAASGFTTYHATGPRLSASSRFTRRGGARGGGLAAEVVG